MYYLWRENKAADQLLDTAKLICVFVFAYAKYWVSHDAAHFVPTLDMTYLKPARQFFIPKGFDYRTIDQVITVTVVDIDKDLRSTIKAIIMTKLFSIYSCYNETTSTITKRSLEFFCLHHISYGASMGLGTDVCSGYLSVHLTMTHQHMVKSLKKSSFLEAKCQMTLLFGKKYQG